MTSRLYSEFNVKAAKEIKESFSESTDNYYLFFGKTEDFDEASPPLPSNAVANSVYQTYDEMVGGKRITADDVSLGIKAYTWQSGTRYTQYDDTATDLEDSTFYIVTSEGSDKYVWKCVDNNSNGVSNQQPLFATVSSSLEQITINAIDGYQWRFMYHIDSSTDHKFSSNNYVPVVAHANAQGNAINGAIDNYKVTTSGNGYAVFANGAVVSNTTVSNTTSFVVTSTSFTLSSNNDFYNQCGIYFTAGAANGQYGIISDWDGTSNTITLSEALSVTPNTSSRFEITPNVLIVGDGSGAKARLSINPASNTGANVQVMQRGSGYTHAVATVQGNTNGTTAAVRPIISPIGGHGFNPENELFARYLLISTNLTNNESLNIPTHNDFRTLGIVRDPMYANVEIGYTDATGTFVVGNTVTHSVTNATGVITFSNSSILRLTNAVGMFIPSNSTYSANITITGVASANLTSMKVNAADSRSNHHFFEQTTKYGINMTTGGVFSEDETLTATDYSGNAVVYFANSTELSVTSIVGNGFPVGNASVTLTGGTSAQTATIANTTGPDLLKGTGTILYLENIEAVSRSNTTTETVKMVIKF